MVTRNMNNKLLMVELCLAIFISTHRAVSSSCNVIDNFKEEEKVKLVGDSKWQNSCPYNRYIQAIYADIPTAPFTKAKCCGDDVDSALSWEIDALYAMDQGETSSNKTWNVECEKFAAITGFKFTVSHYNSRSLTAIRCSVLTNEFIDRSNCTVMDLSSTVKSTVRYNETWQHECPTGYGLVGVYSSYNFKRIEKAKCCKINKAVFKPGVLFDFEKSHESFTRSNVGGLMFTINGNGFFEARNIGSSNDLKYARLISVGITINEPLCLEITSVSMGRDITLIVYQRTNTTFQKIKEFTSSGHSRQNIQHVFLKKNDVTNRTSQVILDAKIGRGLFFLRKIKVLKESLCKVDQCQPTSKSCPPNETCLPREGYLKCECKIGYVRSSTFKCVLFDKTTHISTVGTHKSGKKETTTPATIITTDSKLTTRSKTYDGTTKESSEYIVMQQCASPWLYSFVGAACGIVLVVLVLGGCLFYNRTFENHQKSIYKRKMEMAYKNQRHQRGSSAMRDTGSVVNNSGNLPPLYENGFFITPAGFTSIIDPNTKQSINTRK